MTEIVSWLNNNQGFTMSMLTLVYVLATLVIVIYNRKSIKELQNTREEESRPYIFAYLHRDPRDVCFYFRVKNYGKTGAKIENIEVSPPLNFIDRKNPAEFLNNIILAPNQMLHFIMLERNEETAEKKYDVTIKYHPTSSLKKTYEGKYSLIMQYSSQMGYTDNKKSNLSDGDNALNNIANYLDSIRNKL
ncbi:MAG TPA: hypothetical protein DEF34_08255 [Desulfotomaculum sp.]|nr:MAG: hypothetical protein VR67_09970 [Peptococcaceae bacterium BRH_c8a]KJS71340.1 MAG: hypothetical protein JL56_15230 [Desulfotomaculum sp. BICA1-6]HBX23605.1 hypothetical protein [Desulfotomaculum sp.]